MRNHQINNSSRCGWIRKRVSEPGYSRSRNIIVCLLILFSLLQVAYFDGKGRGVIATRPFGRGQFVVEYSGELVGVAEAREREYKYAQDPEAGCYMYYFRHGDQQYWWVWFDTTGKKKKKVLSLRGILYGLLNFMTQYRSKYKWFHHIIYGVTLLK